MSEDTTAMILSGKEASQDIRSKLKEQVSLLKSRYGTFEPGLAIVQVGNREDSNVYIRMKIKAAEEIGIKAQHIRYPNTLSETQLLQEIQKLNDDPFIHGMIVQLPLDTTQSIDSDLVVNSISQQKDVDGLTIASAGSLSHGNVKTGFLPCTPNGCMDLIKRSGVEIQGAKAVVLGRSKIVGTPMAELLKWHHATVTVCHSRTKGIDEICRSADILVVGIGKAQFVKGAWVKPGACVIDCGINAIPDATKKSGQRLVGDVAYAEVSKVASFITPVPGGVGPMTVAMLMQNTVTSAARFAESVNSPSWNLSYNPLDLKYPTPKSVFFKFNQRLTRL